LNKDYIYYLLLSIILIYQLLILSIIAGNNFKLTDIENYGVDADLVRRIGFLGTTSITSTADHINFYYIVLK